MSELALQKAISRRIPELGVAVNHGGRQRTTGLSNLRGLRVSSHCRGLVPLPGRRAGHRVEEHGLCLGLHDDRSMQIALPLGDVPPDQGCDQTVCPAGPEGIDSDLHQPSTGQCARCQSPGYRSPVEGVHRGAGSRLHGLSEALRRPSAAGLLRHPGQEQFTVPSHQLQYGQEFHPCRSD